MASVFTGKYEMDSNGVNRIIDEYGNSMIAMRMVRWRDTNEFKLDIRKYRFDENGETPNKGITFLTEEGPGELAKALLEEGYGNSDDIAESLYKTRPDICNRVLDLMDGKKLDEPDREDDGTIEDLYDPREVLG